MSGSAKETQPPEPGTARRPLVMTADLPGSLHSRMDALRRAHFPSERNLLTAHVTLFHALPSFVEDEAKALLAELGRHSPPQAHVSGIMDLGAGTAFRIESPDMLAMRESIADRFHGLLTGQDQHVPRLHVTIQNKVTVREARALQAELSASFLPEPFRFAGLSLHRYLGGPWEAIGSWRFRG